MAVSALAGCGSQSAGELPPPAGPPHSPPPAVRPAGEVMNGSAPVREGGRPALADGRVAVVAPRARKLELHGRSAESAPAGVGPTHVACLPAGPCWVLDTRGDALLVFSLRPHLELVRRLYLPGGPYGVALDPARRRLWITLPALNELVERR